MAAAHDTISDWDGLLVALCRYKKKINPSAADQWIYTEMLWFCFFLYVFYFLLNVYVKGDRDSDIATSPHKTHV